MKYRNWLASLLIAFLTLAFAGLNVDPASAQNGGQERPELKDEALFVTNRFVIHYTETGEDGIDSTDKDDSGFPDYVEEVAQSLEYSWDYEINQMGWSPPPLDQGEGGDNRFDVYLQDIMPDGIAGYAQSEGGYVGDNPETPERERRAAYSYLALDNDYAEVDGTEFAPLNLMKATVAHEFNHVIQAGYDDFDPQTWLYESTATWMEMQVYPDISDSRAYLPDVLDAPDVCRTARSGWYGSWLFIQLLSEKYGRDIVRSIWENSRQLDGYSAIDETLKPYGSTLTLESRDFAVSNLLRVYHDGQAFPTVQVEGSVDEGVYNPNNGVQSLGADYVELTGSGLMRVAFEGDRKLTGEAIAIRGGEADRFDLSQPVTLDLSAYDASYVVVHDDEQSITEDDCRYRDYAIDVSAATDSTSAPTATLSAPNFTTPTSGNGGTVDPNGSSTYHPPYSGGGNTGAVSTAAQDLEVAFATLSPEPPPIGYEFDYAYTMTAADFGSSADYYVPNGDISANFDYVSSEDNWLSLSESPSPYDTLQAWLDGVGYEPEGDIRDIDGVEVLVEDLSDGGETSISATLIVDGLFIVVDGDHSEDDVLAMVEAVIATSQPPEVQGGTQFPSPDIDLSVVTPSPNVVPETPPIDTNSVLAMLGISLCGLSACGLAVGGGALMLFIFRRRQ